MSIITQIMGGKLAKVDEWSIKILKYLSEVEEATIYEINKNYKQIRNTSIDKAIAYLEFINAIDLREEEHVQKTYRKCKILSLGLTILGNIGYTPKKVRKEDRGKKPLIRRGEGFKDEEPIEDVVWDVCHILEDAHVFDTENITDQVVAEVAMWCNEIKKVHTITAKKRSVLKIIRIVEEYKDNLEDFADELDVPLRILNDFLD